MVGDFLLQKNFAGLRFGYVNGKYRAFLIQNVCPVTEEYIDCQYMIENNSVPVTIDDKLSAQRVKLMGYVSGVS